MIYLKKNRVVPVIFSIINITFWICFRQSSKLFKNYPFMNYINSERVQAFLFLVLGFTLIWSLYACDSERKYLFLKAAGIGISFLLFLKIYNLARGTVVYNISSRAGLAGILSGEIVFYFLKMILGNKNKNDSFEMPYCLDSISKYRNHLMGLAMLYVMLFHTTITKAQYGDGILYFFVKCGNSGVDIFIFLSGLGMAYSLTKNFNIMEFYKKRILRIYPDYIPLVGIYSLVCWKKGLCSMILVILNCAGISFWISESSYAFNWYIPAIIVFYLLAPGIYLLLKDKERRNFSFAAIYFISLFFIIISNDYLKWNRLMIAFCRFPVFLVGMVVGFWILEKKRITKSEYISMAFIFIVTLFLYVAKVKMSIPLVGWHWLPYGILAPVFCLLASGLMEHIRKDSGILVFLEWVGKNSLLLYLVNILVVRFTKMFVSGHLGKRALVGNLYSIFAIILNFAVVFLIIKIKENLKWRKLLWKKQ